MVQFFLPNPAQSYLQWCVGIVLQNYRDNRKKSLTFYAEKKGKNKLEGNESAISTKQRFFKEEFDDWKEPGEGGKNNQLNKLVAGACRHQSEDGMCVFFLRVCFRVSVSVCKHT